MRMASDAGCRVGIVQQVKGKAVDHNTVERVHRGPAPGLILIGTVSDVDENQWSWLKEER